MTCIVFSQFANVSNFPRWHDRLEIAVHNCTFPYFNSAFKQSKRSLKFWHNTAVAVASAGMLPTAIDGPEALQMLLGALYTAYTPTVLKQVILSPNPGAN